MKYVIGIDIGTTNCKAVSITFDGKVLKELKSGYPVIESANGQQEQDAELIFGTVLRLLESLPSYLNAHDIAAVCFSSAMHSIMAVNNSGAPLSNAITWADTRSIEFAEQLKQEGKAETLYQLTGVPVHPMSPLCKIMWMKKYMPEIFKAAYKFISVKEYIFLRLFGEYVVDVSIASASGLFDISKREWSGYALETAEISQAHLSKPVPVTSVFTGIQSEWIKLISLYKDVPFIIGGSDGCLANLGSGALEKDEAALTIGTSGAVRMFCDHVHPDPLQRLFNYYFSEGLYITGGPINNGGIVLKWFAENFLGKSFDSTEDFTWFLQLAAKAPAGSEGLIFLPYLFGERAPYWDAYAKGVLFGLRGIHNTTHLARSVVEGISFALYDVLESLEEVNGKIERIYATGGFVQSDLWVQIIADVLNKTVIVSATVDASAVGAALTGMLALGELQSWKEMKKLVPQGKVFEPDQQSHSIYRSSFEIYRSLYKKLKDEFRSTHS